MNDLVLAEKRGNVGLITINRPDALNAVNSELAEGIHTHTKAFDEDPEIGCIVITGAGKAFIAGADIKEMLEKSYMDMFMENKQAAWEVFAATRTPIIAAVNGFALGGGCELAMMCDMIFASTEAKFGQPEIKLGVTPGWGGSQRLARYIGKAKAMDLILTGRMMDAQEAERSGLVARLCEPDQLLDEAMKAAETIAGFGRPSVYVAKEQVNRAFETTLTEGLMFERRTFYALFATEDRTEGMKAFSEKRKPEFKNK